MDKDTKKFLITALFVFIIFWFIGWFILSANAQDDIIVQPPAVELPVEDPGFVAPGVSYNPGFLYVPREYSFDEETRDLNRPDYHPTPRRRNLLDNFSGCIFTPIPIDHRFVGCKINFAPVEPPVVFPSTSHQIDLDNPPRQE